MMETLFLSIERLSVQIWSHLQEWKVQVASKFVDCLQADPDIYRWFQTVCQDGCRKPSRKKSIMVTTVFKDGLQKAKPDMKPHVIRLSFTPSQTESFMFTVFEEGCRTPSKTEFHCYRQHFSWLQITKKDRKFHVHRQSSKMVAGYKARQRVSCF